MIPHGRFEPMRTYPYGSITQSVLSALANGRTLTSLEIYAACPMIERRILQRNISAMCSKGILINVGNRQHALYRIAPP